MTVNDIRTKYLEFMKRQGHAILPSASIRPENDPTTLFTGSGMQPLLPYLLGEPHPAGTRVADSQKCFRAEDIEEVGDNRHTTFFEMLGNWSFGDYFKEEQLQWFFTFLVDEIGLDPCKLYVTVFSGDEERAIPADTESVEIWKRLFAQKGIVAHDVEMISEEEGARRGMQGGRIFYYNAKKNWWSRAGVPQNMPAGEPGGPDSEVFYEFTDVEHDTSFGEHCHPNCDCGRFIEIGNSVFMEYIKNEDGTFGFLPQKNVDFGGGLERIVAAAQNSADVFTISAFQPVIQELESRSGKAYGGDVTKNMRVVADHVRGATFMLAEGIVPSNTDQGYVLRRLIRRAVRHADTVGLAEQSFSSLAEIVIREYAQTYDALEKERETILQELDAEEAKFRKTLAKGMQEFEKMVADREINGKDAFILFSTYGFPLEMTLELAQERGITVNEDEYRSEFEKHRELSRTASQGKFKGGLVDHSEMSVKYHTATHLLHQALRTVLGDHVLQRGSNITPERLRFDFSHPEKMTDEQKQEVERLVNEKIQEDLPVHRETMPTEEARKLGAIGLFGEKYGDTVSVYKIGATGSDPYSIEFCGGPHVERTGVIGKFRIKKEESVGAGVRRIKAVVE
jgi:alanyl-tRNA synthetase